MKHSLIAGAISLLALSTNGAAGAEQQSLSGESLAALNALAHCPAGTLEALMEGAHSISNGTLSVDDMVTTYMIESEKVIAFEPAYVTVPVHLLEITQRYGTGPSFPGHPTPVVYSCRVHLVGP